MWWSGAGPGVNQDVSGAKGMRNPTGSISPRSCARRSSIWHTTMKPQVLTMPREAMLSTISNTWLGTR